MDPPAHHRSMFETAAPGSDSRLWPRRRREAPAVSLERWTKTDSTWSRVWADLTTTRSRGAARPPRNMTSLTPPHESRHGVCGAVALGLI
jgi:hypothetical protein